jgi:DNA-binding IclR family transcriptional regulator
MSTQYQAPSVKKAFHILRLLADNPQSMGITELARRMGLSKGTVHGVTAALEELGAIRRDPVTKKYTLGLALFELGRRAYSQIDLNELARPVMEDLMEKVQESVFLGVLSVDHITILDIVESRQELKITSPTGTTLRLTAGAVGKVFLAFMKYEKALDIIEKNGLPRYTEKSITDPVKYAAELRKINERKYATDDEEYIMGVRAVAAPIQGDRDLMAAIWVVGFKASLDDEKMALLAREIKKAVDEISRRIAQHMVGP